MTGRGVFAAWQPRYAALGIATFPVNGKVPAIRNYDRLPVAGSNQLPARFAEAEAFGLSLAPSGIVVIDVDTPSESVLADAVARYGETPFVVRSGGGNFQAWYRRTDEGRRIRPDPAVPIDVLGKGFVVAPPSQGTRGVYEIIRGSLDDLAHLPPLATGDRGAGKFPRGSMTGAGHRNDTLWRHCMHEARHCDDLDALVDVARTANEGYLPPLEDAEVLKVARSAWGYTERGENRIGRGGRVMATHAEVDNLMQACPDAFLLLTFLRRHHWGRTFVIANALAEGMPGGGWTRKRLAAARKWLEASGAIELVKSASLRNGPAVYRFKGGQF